MSRTNKNSSNRDEYWSPRPNKYFSKPGKKTKKYTHKIERRKGKINDKSNYD
jgi:hypothetical protein